MFSNPLNLMFSTAHKTVARSSSSPRAPGECSTEISKRLDQFGLSCARVERVSLDERLNAARQVRHKIYKSALVPCQGLDFGYVIAKRPPLSDFSVKDDPNF